MFGNCFRHVALPHWIVPYFILNWLSNKLLVDVWPFLVEMMAVTTDGSLLWQTPAYDGEDAACIQRSLSLHFLQAISIMWLISVTHAFDDQFEDKTMTTHASVSSLTVMALCVEGHVLALA